MAVFPKSSLFIPLSFCTVNIYHSLFSVYRVICITVCIWLQSCLVKKKERKKKKEFFVCQCSLAFVLLAKFNADWLWHAIQSVHVADQAFWGRCILLSECHLMSPRWRSYRVQLSWSSTSLLGQRQPQGLSLCSRAPFPWVVSEWSSSGLCSARVLR